MFGFGNTTIVGMDIGSNFVKAVEIGITKEGCKLLSIGMEPLPPEAIVDGTIIDFNPVVTAIQKIYLENNIKTKDVHTAISGKSVIIKRIKLPFMSKDELEESITWEAQQHIPFDIEEVNLSFQILSESEQTKEIEVLLVAAKKSKINNHINVIKSAGLNPKLIDVDAFAVQNCCEFNQEMEKEQTVALVHFGGAITNINIVKNNIPFFTRDINVAGNTITADIQKKMFLGYEEAEQLKLSLSKESYELEADNIAKEALPKSASLDLSAAPQASQELNGPPGLGPSLENILGYQTAEATSLDDQIRQGLSELDQDPELADITKAPEDQENTGISEDDIAAELQESLDYDVDDLIGDDLASELGFDVQDAAELPIETGATATIDAQSTDQAKAILESVIDNLTVEIQNSFEYFHTSTTEESSVSKIILSGGSSKLAGVCELLAQKLELEVQISNPLQNIEYDPTVFDIKYINQVAPLLSVAVGLAVRKVSRHD